MRQENSRWDDATQMRLPAFVFAAKCGDFVCMNDAHGDVIEDHYYWRIVRCINACAGISNDELDRMAEAKGLFRRDDE